MNFVEILKVIVLGIVEGFTEWLPISSTGHMILVDEIIHLDVSGAFREVFMVVIQLGAILAVLLLYFHKLNPFSQRKNPAQKRATIRLWKKIIVACVPAALVGLPLDNVMDKLLNGYVVSATLIIYGIFFIFLEQRNRNVSFPIQRVTQVRSDDPGGHADRVLQGGGGGVLILPGDSGYVRGQPAQDC